MRQRPLWWIAVASSSAALLAVLISFHVPDLLAQPTRLWGRTVHLKSPSVVLLLAALPWLALSARSSLTGLAPAQRALSLLLRVGLLSCWIFAAAQPVEVVRTDRVCAFALVDVSASIGDSALTRASQAIGALLQAPTETSPAPASELRVIAFGQDAHLVPLDRDADGKPMAPSGPRLRSLAAGQESDLEGAFRLARAVSATDCVKRYLLFSDGIETIGQAASAIAEEVNRGARVSVLPLTDRPPADVAIVGLDTDRNLEVGEPFEVRVQLRSTAPARGTLQLLQNDEENGLGGRTPLVLSAGEHTTTFKSIVRVPGEVRYRAQWLPEAGDQFATNNRFESNLDVPGPPRVLLVDREPGQASHLARALVAQQFDVDVRAPSAFPAAARELSDFSFVILSDLSRQDLSRGSENLLLGYVRQGGGLLFSGGEASYGPGGWQGSALGRILPVRMDSEKTREVPGVAMSLVIDRSGSMTGLPLQMAKEACIATLSVLSDSDVIEVIAFDSKPTRFVPLQKARYRSRVESSLLTMQPGGGTEIFSSLDMAYQDLASFPARKKHIILLTDGNAASDGIYDLSVAAFSEGITITTVGLGAGANSELLGMIAEAGGGRFHPVDDPAHLPRIFTRETELISKQTHLTDWVPVVPSSSAPFLAGIPVGRLPYLRGLSRTQMRSAPSELILQTDTGDPVLARRREGLGWALAWTSDLKPHWGADFLKWGPFGQFMAQLARAHQLTDTTRVLDMRVERIGSRVRAEFDAYDDHDRFDSSLVSELIIKTPGGKDQQVIQTAFAHAAPGRYVAQAELPGYGSFALLASHRRRTPAGELLPVGISRGSVSRPYPDEYQDLSPRPQTLATWARIGQGHYAPTDARVALDAGEDRVIAEMGRQAGLIFLSLGLLLLDLFVRRVRLIDRQFRRPLP